MNILVTGGAGFIGSNYLRYVREMRPENKLVCYDALTYAGNLSTIQDLIDDGSVVFKLGYVQDASCVAETIQQESITHIVNFAAESHNDRSILNADSFIQTNVTGVYTLLEATKKFELEKMVHVSTDEVYGSTLEGEFTEQSPLQPNTPYSASKAGGDLQCRSHFVSFKTPVCVTRGGNTYGPYQYPEKLISFFTVRLIEGKRVPLYGEGHQVREWIHVQDHCTGIDTVLTKGQVGEVYNIGDENERRNIDIVERLLHLTGRSDSLIKRIEDPRKGAHDARYSMRCDKLHALGWHARKDFAAGLEETVNWYQKNELWWREIIARPDYQAFIRQFYGPGLGDDL